LKKYEKSDENKRFRRQEQGKLERKRQNINGVRYGDHRPQVNRNSLMKLMNEAVDKVRREEQSHNALLKRTRYIWLKNPENLTIKQNETLEPLKNIRLKTMKAYNIKLALRDFWSFGYRKSAEDYLKRWYYWATHSRLDPVIECAKMIKNHWNGVTNYIKTKIDNGILEGTNSLIQAAKDSARGFRSTKNFITTIYLRTGKLKFNLPT